MKELSASEEDMDLLQEEEEREGLRKEPILA